MATRTGDRHGGGTPLRSQARDEDAWDAFVEDATGGDLVQTSAWARAKGAVSLDSGLVVVRDEGGAILGGAQAIVKRIGPGVAAGSVARGPLLRDPSSDADAEAVVERVIAGARAAGVRLLIVQPPEGCEAVERALDARRFGRGCPSVAPEATVRLDLRRTDAELLGGMSRMRRRNLRKPGSAGLSIGFENDVELFQRLHAATAARQGFTPMDLDNLRAQWDALAPAGRCMIMVARHDGVPISGLWLTSFAGTITFKLAGWNVEAAARTSAPKHLNETLHWAAIRWARQSGAHTFDLGGIDRGIAELLVAGAPLPEGFTGTTAYFKYGFGGERLLLPLARWALLGPALAAVGRPIVGRMLASPRMRSVMTRVRNG